MTNTDNQLVEQVGPPRNKFTNSLSHVVTDLGKNGIFLALIAVVVLFSILTNGILLRPQNISNLIVQNGYILILAIGMVIVIVAGHIDLSVGSIAGFVGAMSAVLMIKNDMPWPLAVLLCLVLGAAIGAWQGFWIAYVGIPSFIVTLAGMLVFRGATQYLLEGQSIAPFPRSFSQVSSGFLPEVGGNSLYHWPTVILGVLVISFGMSLPTVGLVFTAIVMVVGAGALVLERRSQRMHAHTIA